MPRGVATAPKKVARGPKAHKLAEEFPAGTILQDLCKKQWQLSSVIGQGGFGLIYLASEETSKQVDKKSANYVIKIEPKDNGPLYCEMHFYQRVAKPNLIQSFITAHKLRYLSVPPYISTGRQLFNGKEYRFLVMPRFGTDLQKYLVQSNGHFSPQTTFGVGLRMLDALEFLHENEYVHADVKAANILTGFHAGSEVVNEVYLVDYGLAYRYTVDGVHKEYKEDPRKAHDGTIEFTSRDAHKGVAPSRRGDLEILGYCMLQWLCGSLPWEDNLTDQSYVAASKERLVDNPQLLIAACLRGPKTPSSECMCKYMEKVKALTYDSRPDYKSFRDLLRTAGQKAGQKDEWKLDLTSSAKGSKRKSGEMDSPAKAKKKKATDSPAVKAPKAGGAKPSPGKAKAKKRAVGGSSPVKSPKASKHSPVKKMHVSPSAAKASPKPKAVPNKVRKSPLVLSVPTKAMSTHLSPRTNGTAKASHKKIVHPMPPATKPSPRPKAKKTTVRRVKRVTAVKSDMGIQTSPGLYNNR